MEEIWKAGVGGMCKCHFGMVFKVEDDPMASNKCLHCHSTFNDLDTYYAKEKIELNKRIADEKAELASKSTTSSHTSSAPGATGAIVFPDKFTNVSVKNLFTDVVEDFYNNDPDPFTNAQAKIGKVDDGTLVQMYWDVYNILARSDKTKLNALVRNASTSDECVQIFNDMVDGTITF